MQVYTVARWKELYETRDTRRKARGKLPWVKAPTNFAAEHYAELVEGPGGAARYGVWCAIRGLAALCCEDGWHRDGRLVRDDGSPHDAASIARITRLPREAVEDAIPVLIRIGWLEISEALGHGNENETSAVSSGNTRGRRRRPLGNDVRDVDSRDGSPLLAAGAY